MMMQFSKTLSNRLVGFGRKYDVIRSEALAIKALLIKEHFIQTDTPYSEVMNNTLLLDTLTMHLALSLSTDVATSKFSRGHLSDFDLFVNGKNDTALHQLIKEKNITMEAQEFLSLTKSRNSLLTFMRDIKKNLILYMQLEEGPTPEKQKAPKTKQDMAANIEKNAGALKELVTKRKADEVLDGFIADSDDEAPMEEDGLTDITQGEKKKAKKGSQLKGLLVRNFPSLKTTGVFLLMDDDEDLYFQDTFIVSPEKLILFETL